MLSNLVGYAAGKDKTGALLRPSLRTILRNWWPVAVWLGVIRLESTSYASADNTFHLLYRFLYVLFGRIDVGLVWTLDHVLRKSGHFIGYAILSLLTFWAFQRTHRDRLRLLLKRSWGTYLRDIWQWPWALAAILLTVVTASFDEIHQTFLAERTGRWQDVVIDTSGAVAIQIVIYAICVWRLRTPSKEMASPVLSLTGRK